MTWTFISNPGTSTADERREAVRLLIGDTDSTDQKLQDEVIEFFLSQANNDIYGAAEIGARALAAKYASLVDTSVEGISERYSQMQQHYRSLATSLRQQGKRSGSSGLGIPHAGGLSVDARDAVYENEDAIQSVFQQDQFKAD